MAQILVVEDDPSINELIVRNLKLVGHSYLQAFDGTEAVRIASESPVDLILLDIMLPKMDGFEVIKNIPPTPVIYITAKDGLEHRLNGLSLGADDYIVKPFEMLELLARIEAVLRRTQKNGTAFSLDNAIVDLASRTAKVNGVAIDLSPREFELLEVLIRNRNIALSREKLLELAWGYDYAGETRTVDTHIQKLRSKLGWENRIKTLYKLGYRLEV
jgi:DNA-binding response OmpR family regulator